MIDKETMYAEDNYKGNYQNVLAFIYHVTNGYSNLEIANILNCSLENAKIRLHRARKKMKEILGNDCSLYYDERNVYYAVPLRE